MSVTVNRTSLSERQLLSQLFFFQASVTPFKMQDFSHANTHTRCLGEVLSASPLVLLLLTFWCFLAWRGCFLLSLGRETAISFLCEKTTQVSDTSVNKSQVLVKGVMLRQVLFWYFTLTGGMKKLQC